MFERISNVNVQRIIDGRFESCDWSSTAVNLAMDVRDLREAYMLAINELTDAKDALARARETNKSSVV